MKPFFAALLFFGLMVANATYAQKVINKTKFFQDTSVVNATLTLNLKKIMAQKDKIGLIYPATFSCKVDSLNINDHISVEVRGHFRRGYCYLPPLKLNYRSDPSDAFYKLKSLKLVSACMTSYDDDQNLLKEFMIYKIYNLITDKSFRVRLLNLSYQDSSGKKKPITQHAFLLESDRELAKRNNCDDWTEKKFISETTDRRQMTIVAIFEYMIGNTDWAVPGCHNIKLLHSLSDSTSRPYVVPYDFDFSGLVGTDYSAPADKLGIDNVKQRLYRGFPRSMAELNDVLGIFNKQKTNIYAMINSFNLFDPAAKKDMIKYLDEFYDTINDQAAVKQTFITDARTN